MSKQKRYLANCFLLLIPVFLWNILLYDKLPPAFQAIVFWKDIPPLVSYPENFFRITLFTFPVIMFLSFRSSIQKTGLVIYIIGLILYFLSWLIMIYMPDSSWAESAIGFTAPAYSSLFWLIGIAFIGKDAFFKIPNTTTIYLILSVLFVCFHTAHAYIVFERL